MNRALLALPLLAAVLMTVYGFATCQRAIAQRDGTPAPQMSRDQHQEAYECLIETLRPQDFGLLHALGVSLTLAVWLALLWTMGKRRAKPREKQEQR